MLRLQVEVRDELLEKLEGARAVELRAEVRRCCLCYADGYRKGEADAEAGPPETT